MTCHEACELYGFHHSDYAIDSTLLNQVYLTDLSTRESTLLCKEEHPVLRLALQGDEWLWVATTDSSLHKWPARERAVTKALQRASSFVAGSLPFARARANIDGSAPVRCAVLFS